MTRSLILTLCTISAACLPLSSLGQTVYSSFGSGQSYDESRGWTIDGPTSSFGGATGLTLLPATEFAPSSGGVLSSVDVALAYLSGTNLFTVSLDTDNGGQPGTVLESWTPTGLASFGGPTLITLTNAVSGLTLTAGTNYWLAIAPGASDSEGAWDDGVTNGTDSWSLDGGSTWNQNQFGTLQGAFSVQVVPEPAPFAALGLGVLPLLFFRRRAR